MAHRKLTVLHFSYIPVSLGAAAAAGGTFRGVPPAMPPVAFSQFPPATHTSQLLGYTQGPGGRTTTCKVPKARVFAPWAHGSIVFGLPASRIRR